MDAVIERHKDEAADQDAIKARSASESTKTPASPLERGAGAPQSRAKKARGHIDTHTKEG